jgi:hypothetical protein
MRSVSVGRRFVLVFCVVVGTATAAAASQTPTASQPPRLEILTRQGDFYWVVETAPDGSRKGGWVNVSVPLDRIDKSAFQPLPALPPLPSASQRQQPDTDRVNERLARIEQALGQTDGPGVTTQSEALVQATPIPVAQPRQQAPAIQPQQRIQTREGFWFNAGMGWGSATCQSCLNNWGGLSGGLSLGGTISDRFLLGVGTSGWYKSENGYTVNGGTLDTRFRFYPVVTSGFFLTGGLGLGHLTESLNGFGSVTEYGVGALFGLGWDLRVGRNVSLTPFYNGFAVQTPNADGNVTQIGLGVTIH